MEAAPDLRCARCGTAVEGTLHTRAGWVVGHYVLHTGRTEEATVRRRDDEAPLVYRRLVEPLVVVCCPACWRQPTVQARWLAFGGEEGAG